ncbi:MAG TPA: hypothetical protein VGZ22_27900 [Isosphaeraceae bacterium]|jgi:hypothetical protein|nr:hypothetical protein [Isosphaeraceae bacterium]
MQAPGRKFNLIEAIIVIAALACGFALARMGLSASFPLARVPSQIRLSFMVQYILTVVCSCLSTLTFAQLVLMLRSTRARTQEILQQPGTAACAVAAVIIFSSVAASVVNAGLPVTIIPRSFALLSIPVGMGVGTVWLMMWTNGHWKGDPSWIDRMGRVLGYCWLLMPEFYLGALMI